MPGETAGLRQVLSKSYATEQIVQVQQRQPTEDQYRSVAHMQQQKEAHLHKSPPPPKAEGGRVEERRKQKGRKRKEKEGEREEKEGLALKGQVIDILA
ncbi:MAG TPA: hypothetical protein EYP17_12585 [Candidatus Latescibacteria bacterium]|nr:hypothetical protein [Candidatus Latescibacterota bacterium]